MQKAASVLEFRLLGVDVAAAWVVVGCTKKEKTTLLMRKRMKSFTNTWRELAFSGEEEILTTILYTMDLRQLEKEN